MPIVEYRHCNFEDFCEDSSLEILIFLDLRVQEVKGIL